MTQQIVVADAKLLADMLEQLNRIEAKVDRKSAPPWWISADQYAEKCGITVKAAQMRAQRGQVETRGSGVARRYRNPEV